MGPDRPARTVIDRLRPEAARLCKKSLYRNTDRREKPGVTDFLTGKASSRGYLFNQTGEYEGIFPYLAGTHRA